METTTKAPILGPDIPSSDNPTEAYSFAKLNAYWQQYGNLFRLPITTGSGWIYVISDPTWVKHVLSSNHKNYRKGLGIERVRVLLGNGLMASEGERWHTQRKMIQPMVHRKRMSQIETIILQENQQLLSRWQQQAAQKEPIDITRDMSELTLNFILAAIFSDDLQTIVAKYQSNPFLLVSEDTNRNLEFARKFRELTKLVAEIIQKRRDQQHRPVDFLSHLIDARDKKTNEPMTDKQIINEVMTLVVAGHETTASSLNWVWFLLAKHPEHQQKILTEVLTVFGQQPFTLTKSDQLQHTQCVIKEALRLYPPGWLLTRRSINDDEIAGNPIKPNSDIYISPYLVHRNCDHWHEPDKFIPERFHNDAAVERQKFAYIPFGAGPRNCLGDEIAMLEMQMHIAYMLKHFEITLNSTDQIELEADVNLRPKNHLLLKITPRKTCQ